MYVTLVKYREDHVHHEHGQSHQYRQTRDRAAKRQRLALQLRAHTRRHNLRCLCGDEVSRITKSNARFEVEEECHTRELVQVVHCLWSKRGFPGNELTERHE